MRIVIICGSLEPGKDGVGDYTRRLAAELTRQGNTVKIFSLNDCYVNKEVSEIQNIGNIYLQIHRIPSTWTNKKRYKYLKDRITAIAPDYISLQYVPYSFNSYGTPFFLSSRLASLNKQAKWHIMVHEPFLINKNSTLKSRIVRRLQILSLQLLKMQLHPVWHTSIPFYKRHLDSVLSIQSGLLGLFGNIAIQKGASTSINNVNGKSVIKAVYFGTVPPLKHHHIFIKKFREQFSNIFSQIELVFCGKGGGDEQMFIAAVKNILSTSKHTVSVCGVLPSEELSKLFLEADFGIARVSPKLIGKSGSAIAMLEHGLPLWIPMAEAENFTDDIEFRPELCFASLQTLNSIQHKHQIVNRLPQVAKKMISDLRGAPENTEKAIKSFR